MGCALLCMCVHLCTLVANRSSKMGPADGYPALVLDAVTIVILIIPFGLSPSPHPHSKFCRSTQA